MVLDRTDLLKGIQMRRDQVEEAQAHVADCQGELESSIEFGDLQKAKDRLTNRAYDLTSLEAEYREVCLESFKETGEKQQPGGIIKTFKTYDYDVVKAIEWAIGHRVPGVLKINAAAFKKVANSMNVEIVTIGEEPRMQISKDLSKWLEGDDEKAS